MLALFFILCLFKIREKNMPFYERKKKICVPLLSFGEEGPLWLEARDWRADSKTNW